MSYLKMAVLAVMSVLFASVAIAQGEYRVQAGDTLNIEVLEDSTLNRSVVVLSDGRISFPLAGTVSVAGRSVGQIEQQIETLISSNFNAEPNVFVAVTPRIPEPVVPVAPAPPPTIEIFFLGEINTPGTVSITPGTRFLQGMALSGGLTRFAADKRIQLRRTDPRTGETAMFQINYRGILNGETLLNNIVLEDGDVIVVPERRLFE